MYQQLGVKVASVGEDVVLKVGNVQWRMFFETALHLSWWMRQCAKRANPEGGGRFGVAGILHDANKGPDFGQPFTPGKVYPVNREMLTKERIAVAWRPQVVALKLAGAEMDLGYQAAQKIAQWIRLHAKQSKRRAGDVTRHWSQIVQG